VTDYRLKLTRLAAQAVAHQSYGAYRLRIEASDAEGEGFDANVFIHRRLPPSPYTQDTVDEFQAVVGPPQMASYPIGEPDPDLNWPYLRLSSVTLDVASLTEADMIWKSIQEQVTVLLRTMAKLDNLQVEEVVWIPSAPDPIDSQSQ
jgi:hypothetical protein